MSRELRELLGELDAYGPSEGVYHLATERARVLTGTSEGRLPKVGRVFAIGAAVAAVTVCIALLALAAHSRTTLPPAKGPTRPARPLTQAELDVFMNKLRPRVSQLQSHITLAKQNLNLAGNPSARGNLSPASSQGNQLAHIADDIEGPVYASFTAVTPPRQLAAAWSNFKHGVKGTVRAIRVAEYDVQQNKLPYTRNDKRAYFRHLEQPLLRLKAALAASAALKHLRLPAWVDKLGTGT
jgi:hypothetical protein